jgi:hypothetical protein
VLSAALTRNKIERAVAVFDYGWTEEQAKGLSRQSQPHGGEPNWKPEHLQKLREWCSVHDKDCETVEGQLEFIAYEILDVYEGIGMALKRAKTVEDAKAAAAPFVKRLQSSE